MVETEAQEVADKFGRPRRSVICQELQVIISITDARSVMIIGIHLGCVH